MRPSSVLPSHYQLQIFQVCPLCGPCESFFLAGLLLLQVHEKPRLSPWPAGCISKLLAAAVDPFTDFIGHQELQHS